MEFLIDRKVWNLVIKKVSPKVGLRIKKKLKKDEWGEYPLKREFVLHVHNKLNDIGDIGNQIGDEEDWDDVFSEKQLVEFEKAMIIVLIETQGLSEKVKYRSNKGKKAEFIIEQNESIDSVEKGFVYLIRNDDIYKIGITDNLLRRFNQLKPDEVLNVVRCSNFESLEKELHKKFKEYRIPQTEYFRLSKNQIELVNIEMTRGADF